MTTNEDLTKLPVFALDIGTHSVIGVVGYSEGGLFHIEAMEEQEHTKRSMQDGQIEDIEAVSEVARNVKAKLESAVGRELTHVCVAAAGRALRTAKSSFECAIPAGGPITKELVYELEMGALSSAMDTLRQDSDNEGLFCVGHSVVRYYVDDYSYSTIVDHKGKKAKVDIIATFLPEEVVSSLEISMQKASLNIEFITLEPIAAMNAVIPAELRLLNLALVDIGAGTSDIAICNDGTVAAYTMATVAGDEITEAIIKQFLVDFETAEKIKYAVSQKSGEIEYTDIMGIGYTVSADEVLEILSIPLNELADIICTKILETNGKSPSAVFLVGGGGRTPLLCHLVAEKLGLDERKVAVGGGNFMKKLVYGMDEKFGPEFATPLGIALTAASEGRYKGFDVFVNGEEKHLIRTGKLSMMDVLLLCGYNYSDIMGRSGKNLLFELNGEKRILRGGTMQSAGLLLNGEPASISSSVSSKDSIHITSAIPGKDAHLSVRNLAENRKHIYVNFCGTDVPAGNVVFINGELGEPEREIAEGDKVTTEKIYTFYNLCLFMGSADCDGFLLNGLPAADDSPLQDGDIITVASSSQKAENSILQLDVLDSENTIESIVQEDNFQLSKSNSETKLENNNTNDEFSSSDSINKDTANDFFELSEQNDNGEIQAQKIDMLNDILLKATQNKLQPENNSEESNLQTVPQDIKQNTQDSRSYEGWNNSKTVIDEDLPKIESADYSKELNINEPIFSPEPLLLSEDDFKSLTVTLNDSKIVLPPRTGGAPYLFLDMLSIANIDPSKPQGDIELLLNGHEASFLEKVQNGDIVSINWVKREN